jgi:hypothetical protein
METVKNLEPPRTLRKNPGQDQRDWQDKPVILRILKIM